MNRASRRVARPWPSVTVIVATYNNRQALRPALRGMLAVDYPGRKDVIVVNDGSTDGTKEMLDREFQGLRGLTVVHLPHGGVCRARNAGIGRARGQIIVNMDHDCVPAKGWLRALVDGFTPGVGVVSSYGFYGGTSTAFLASVLREVGGYDERYAYYREDADLSFTIMERGWAFKLVDAPYTHDHAPVQPRGVRSIVRYAFQRWRYHMNDVLLFKQHPSLAGRFLHVRGGFLISPFADFRVATGLWNSGSFALSSPRGMVFLPNRSPLHAGLIFLLGLLYVGGVKAYRLRGSLKHRKLLL
ncbi:MAG: glycosyltransferase family 2 protein [Candidatus Aenigmarchaeota archaeon]|nr:glycosyltransferase family 2 protein [Candidatus Aenigmarchaeota archaeon]